MLETERLILRPHDVLDFADCVALSRDQQVLKYTLGSQSPSQRTWLQLLVAR